MAEPEPQLNIPIASVVPIGSRVQRGSIWVLCFQGILGAIAGVIIHFFLHATNLLSIITFSLVAGFFGSFFITLLLKLLGSLEKAPSLLPSKGRLLKKVVNTSQSSGEVSKQNP